MRRYLVAGPMILLAMLVLMLGASLVDIVVNAEPASAQVTPIDDEPSEDPPGLGNIVGSPEAGPEPVDAGDRGGWAQLGLAVVLVVAVGFISRKIFQDIARGGDAG